MKECFACTSSIEIGQGIMSVCCRSLHHIKEGKIKDMKTFLEEFKEQGVKHKTCVDCEEYRMHNSNLDKERLSNINISIANDCNCDCFICCNGNRLSYYEENNKIIDELFNSIENWDSIRAITFKGGESLLFGERLLELIAFINEKNDNISINIVTNGTILQMDVLNAISKIKHKLVVVSIDHDESSAHIFRYKSNFSNIIKFIEACKKLNIPNGINLTVSKLNAHILGKLATMFVNDFGIPKERIYLNYLLSPPMFCLNNSSPEKISSVIFELLTNPIFDGIIGVTNMLYKLSENDSSYDEEESKNMYNFLKNYYHSKYNLDISVYLDELL